MALRSSVKVGEGLRDSLLVETVSPVPKLQLGNRMPARAEAGALQTPPNKTLTFTLADLRAA